MLGKERERKLWTKVDISNEGVAWRVCKLLERILTILDFPLVCHSFSGWLAHLHLWMIWSNTKPDQSEWHRELLIHVHLSPIKLPHQLLGCIEASGTATDDSHAWRLATGLSRDMMDGTPCLRSYQWLRYRSGIKIACSSAGPPKQQHRMYQQVPPSLLLHIIPTD